MKKTIMSIAALAAGMATAAATPTIVSSQVRANDPTVLDVVYRVTSDKPTVNVRALAFEDGERSFFKVVRPETFIDGTAANIGDNIAANVNHTLSWKVSSDWATDLAKVKFEILTSDMGQLPLDTITIPATAKTPAVTVSYNNQTAANVFNALLWHYADKAEDIYLTNGYLHETNGGQLAFRSGLANKIFAVDYCFGKMGYEGLNGPVLDFTRSATRITLDFNASTLNGYKKSELSSNFYVGDKAYCVIDISGGPSAASYPVTYLDSYPIVKWGDEYKTTKILLRRVEQDEARMGGTQFGVFYMGVFEITQKQYLLVTGLSPSYYKGDMRPVEYVSWNDIRGNSSTYNWPNVTTVAPSSFMGKLRTKTGIDFDLPTESQWKYACRAGTTSTYNNGGSSEQDLKQLGRYSDNRTDGRGGYAQHTIVGSYLPNVLGIYDMHGNVEEWCLDWYDGADSGLSGAGRVLRGGSWYGSSYYCSTSYREDGLPNYNWYDFIGFRLFWTLANE